MLERYKDKVEERTQSGGFVFKHNLHTEKRIYFKKKQKRKSRGNLQHFIPRSTSRVTRKRLEYKSVSWVSQEGWGLTLEL